MRQLLDAAGGQDITLVPCMPWLLDLPVHRAIAEGEPQWDQPMPPTWVQGGGWGRKRVVLFNDLSPLAQGTIKTMLESSPVGDASCMGIAADDMESELGTVLAKAILEQPEQPPLDFIDSPEELPPIENVLEGVLPNEENESSSAVEEKEVQGEMSEEINDNNTTTTPAGTADAQMDDDLIDRIAAGLN